MCVCMSVCVSVSWCVVALCLLGCLTVTFYFIGRRLFLFPDIGCVDIFGRIKSYLDNKDPELSDDSEKKREPPTEFVYKKGVKWYSLVVVVVVMWLHVTLLLLFGV